MERCMKPITLLSVGEAADYINLPRPTLYHHLREGNIPGIQIGGRWRIELEKLHEFMDRAKRGSQDGPSNHADFASHAAGDYPPSSPDIQGVWRALLQENRSLKSIVAENLLRLQRLRSTLSPEESMESVCRFAEGTF